MKREFVFFVFTAVLIMGAGVAPLWSMDYQHTLEIEDMLFSWSMEADQMHIELSAPTEGWVAVGFNPETAMLNANIIIGYVEDGKVTVADHFGIGKRRHGADTKGGGTGDVENPAGSEKDGKTTISFTLPLESDDKYDPPVKGDGSDVVIFAYGSRDSTMLRHRFRTTYRINLKTGESEKIR